MGTRKEELAQIEREKTIIENQNTIMERLSDVERELQLTRKGHEAATWGEAVEEMEDAELDDVPEKEIENG